ncbi:hypothetical protein BTM29_01525 [Companilactobacillus allii]|uniref:Uncharacterized protein n=1 Tax=Companilactobacillus allii TaxID=1847728 RepID=A0A1P8Q0B2_9LACO|nr:hypothetical protein BTM29_01525 [Companilactobacillus allii]
MCFYAFAKQTRKRINCTIKNGAFTKVKTLFLALSGRNCVFLRVCEANKKKDKLYNQKWGLHESEDPIFSAKRKKLCVFTRLRSKQGKG